MQGRHRKQSWLQWTGINKIGSDILRDIRMRAPYYVSDWTDAVNYRVIPATVYIFFANVLPAIAFSQDMFDRTKGAYGIVEVLMGSAMGGIVFGLLAGQPLTIVGITGPITIFNSTVFEIVEPMKVSYFSFMAWIHIWAFILHVIISMFNLVRLMRYVTMFSCDIFGCFINIIYVEKGIQILARQLEIGDKDAGYFSVVTALCTFIFGFASVVFGKYSPYGTRMLRKFVADYSLPLVVVFFTGFTFFPGPISELKLLRLERGHAYTPAPASEEFGRHWGWFIHFWEGLSVGDVFLALPFAILLTMLFYFDHNISAIMAQAPTWIIRKPSTYHCDFLLLGCTTFVAGILGIPAPNGLIPQAFLHTASLALDDGTVVEQRFSNTVQGLLTLGMMCGPLLIVLHLIPYGILAGLFFMMGITGLLENKLIRRLGLLLTDPSLRDPAEPLYSVRLSTFWWYMIISGIGVAGEVGITQTIAAVGFPGVLFGLMIIGALLPYVFPAHELDLLDAPAASEFVISALDPQLRKKLDEDCSQAEILDENSVETVAVTSTASATNSSERRSHF